MTLLSSRALALAAAMTLTAGVAHAGDVTVTLTGVEARGGELLASLQTRNQFLRPEGAYGDLIAAPQAGTRTVIFRNVAPGDYSFSALHDVNGDRQMQMGPDGRPAEGWAMLNGAALRAAPTFDLVKFTVLASGDVVLTIPMAYPSR